MVTQVYKHPGPHRKIYKHVIYVVPTYANPSGKTMSLRRRQGLVDLARKYDALVICDDVYDFLQWPVANAAAAPTTQNTPPASLPLPRLLPRLSDIDGRLGPSPHDPPGKRFGHAVSNGSFSKLVAPGVRTGWVHGTPDLALGASQTGATRSGGAPSQLAAAMVERMLASGVLDRHLATATRPALQARHAAMVAAVRAELGWAGVTMLEDSNSGLFGGYFVWLTLPEGGPTAAEVAEQAQAEENLVVAPGNVFQITADETEAGPAMQFDRNIRLSFSWEDQEDMVEGVRRLGRVLRRMMDGTGNDAGK